MIISGVVFLKLFQGICIVPSKKIPEDHIVFEKYYKTLLYLPVTKEMFHCNLVASEPS